MLYRYRAATSHFCFSRETKFRWNWREVVANQSCAHRFAQSLNQLYWVIGLWIESWHRNKTACSESNPVQNRNLSRRPFQGRLLRFKSNSTATSDGGTQKLGNDVSHDSESITTKVCIEIGCKWNATCSRKGRLLRFESNSTATSNGGAQKLWNDVWHDSESIATKVCSQIGRRWNAKFESHVVTSVDRTSFDFRSEDCLSYLTW